MTGVAEQAEPSIWFKNITQHFLECIHFHYELILKRCILLCSTEEQVTEPHVCE